MKNIILISLLVMLIACTVSATTTNIIRKNMNGDIRLESDSVEAASWKDILYAFLDGADVDKIVANSTKCVKNTDYSYDQLYEGIMHIVTRGWDWDNYLDLLSSVATVTPVVRTCYNVTVSTVKDSKGYINRFTSFTDFVAQARDNALRHIFDWYDVAAKINDAIVRSDQKTLAFQIGRAINLLLYFPPKLNYIVNSSLQLGEIPDFRWLEDFMKGFINGTKLLSSQNIKTCINETEFIVKSIEDANDQFGKQTDDGYREGVFELADVLEHLRPVNDGCYKGGIDIQTIIQKYIKTFKSPLDIVINAARHFNQIYSDVLGCYQNIHNEKWEEAGKNAGDIFYNIFFLQ